MSDSAREFVRDVNDQFRGLVDNPDSEVRYLEYQEACLQRQLDRDVVRAFNSTGTAGEHQTRDFSGVEHAMSAVIFEGGNLLFRSNGYTAVARESGITAVFCALDHLLHYERPDPVEEVHPGYSNMALVKAGRAVVPAENTWASLGHARWRGADDQRVFAGSTGTLFTSGSSGGKDVLAELRELIGPELDPTLEDVGPVDVLAGMADEWMARLAIGDVKSPVSIHGIRDKALIYIRANQNIH